MKTSVMVFGIKIIYIATTFIRFSQRILLKSLTLATKFCKIELQSGNILGGVIELFCKEGCGFGIKKISCLKDVDNTMN